MQQEIDEDYERYPPAFRYGECQYDSRRYKQCRRFFMPGIFYELTAGSRAAYPSGILFFHAERRSNGLLHKKGEKDDD